MNLSELKRTIQRAIESDGDIDIQAWRILSTLARLEIEWRASQGCNFSGEYGSPWFQIGGVDEPYRASGPTLNEAIVGAARLLVAYLPG